MIIEKFEPYFGKSCEPTTVGNLLQHNGLHLSEPMLFGIGEGLGFIYWDSKQMGYPFFGGRCKQDVLTENIVNNLNLNLIVNETSSKAKAWEFVKSNIDKGIPVGLKLDFYYLEYIAEKIHFAAHYVTLYGYDDQFGYLVDTSSIARSSLSSISEARNASGPMSSRNRAFTIMGNHDHFDLRNVIIKAIHNNAKQYLNPAIQNISYKGIRKAARSLPKWLERTDITHDSISQLGMLMEEAGTGGALFRNMYRDFLKECGVLFPEINLQDAIRNFEKIAPMWTETAKLIQNAGINSDVHPITMASEMMLEIASLEEETMKNLYENTSSII